MVETSLINSNIYMCFANLFRRYKAPVKNQLDVRYAKKKVFWVKILCKTVLIDKILDETNQFFSLFYLKILITLKIVNY